MFKDKARNVRSIIDSIVCESSSWVLVIKEFQNCSMNDMVCD